MQHGAPFPYSRQLQRLTQIAGVAYVAGILLLIALFRGFGERWWFLTPLLFMPVQFWLSPLALLIPVAWKFERRLLPFLALALLLMVFGIAGFRFGVGAPTPAPGARALTVLTYNTGEDNSTSVEPFLRQQSPDIVLLQAVKGREEFQHLLYPGCHIRKTDEFVLISRFPIVSAKLIDTGKRRWRSALAAVYVIDWQGQPITVYSVHVPTLRRDFNHLRGQKPAPASRIARVKQFRDEMRTRVALNESFADLVGSEQGAVIVAGDFNMPSWGYLHSQFSSRLTDAFEATGRGFGFTFPGFDPYLPTFFGTWLRLDYLFCNAAWKPLSCTVEKDRASQHRAVAATFELVVPKEQK